LNTKEEFDEWLRSYREERDRGTWSSCWLRPVIPTSPRNKAASSGDGKNLSAPRITARDRDHNGHLSPTFGATGSDSDEEDTDEEIVMVEGEVSNKPSWEVEFGDELADLPTLDVDRDFDPVGDLDILEALLEGYPTMEIKESPKEVEEEVVEEGEHHCWPVKTLKDRVSPDYPKSREKAKRHLDQHSFSDPNSPTSVLCA
ncbi:hypothetical protein M8C21_028430, partial [Ambrosia artemisiifolia]